MNDRIDLMLKFIRIGKYYVGHASGKRPYDKYGACIDVRGKKYRTPYKELCHSKKPRWGSRFPFDAFYGWRETWTV